MQAIRTQKVSPIATLAGAALFALLGMLAFGASAASANHLSPITDGNDDANGSAVCFVNGAAGIAPNPVDSVEHDMGDDDEAWDPGVDVDGDGIADAGNLTDTDGGTFGFMSDTVVCAGQDDGGEVIGTLASDSFSIAAGTDSRIGEGEYTNKVCGTGHAEGSADLWTPGPFPRADVFPPGGGGGPAGQHATDIKSRFSILFVGGVGKLKITSFEGHVSLDNALTPGGNSDPDEVPGPVPPAEPDRVQDVDTGIGNGVVHIAPTRGTTEGPNPDGNPDTTGGAASTVDPGDPPGGMVPCGNQGVSEFTVDAAFEATLSGDTDVANEAHES